MLRCEPHSPNLGNSLNLRQVPDPLESNRCSAPECKFAGPLRSTWERVQVLPDKGLQYVIVVSSDAQNHHPRASTVVVVPIGTTLRQNSCLQLTSDQTGLTETSEVWANNITTVGKKDLKQPRNPLRTLSRGTVIKVLRCVVRAMGVLPSEIVE
jgi:mRNA-degrading endonuclease toxin of MazEF toxin-antitoxin module